MSDNAFSGAASTRGLSATARAGFIAAFSAYLLWGFLPLYFVALGDTPPLMILAHRIIWSVPTALILILFAGKLRELVAAIADLKVLGALFASSLMIAINWTVYIWAVTQGRVLEGSLGYFINPLVTFLFAAIFFGERFSRVQLFAFGLAFLGVLNQAVFVGQFPWISLSLAVSFAIYSAVRKRTPVDSRVGFGVEAGLLAPFALGYLLFLLPAGVGFFADGDASLALMLVLAGPVTAAPLILFAIGARRLRLSTIGLLQYLAPTIQFGIGLAMGEPFTPARALTFGLIWAGIALFTFSAWRADRRLAAPAAAD
jgi:chloramphenicol-sensitive protein RarD